LVSFGGAGGLHACDTAKALGATRVIFTARSRHAQRLGDVVIRPGPRFGPLRSDAGNLVVERGAWGDC
jgi:hypothetical protein